MIEGLNNEEKTCFEKLNYLIREKHGQWEELKYRGKTGYIKNPCVVLLDDDLF